MFKIQEVKIGQNESRGIIEGTLLEMTCFGGQMALKFFGFLF